MTANVSEPEIQALLADLQNTSAKRRWVTIRKIQASDIDDERIVRLLYIVESRDPMSYVRDEARRVLRLPRYQAVLQQLNSEPESLQTLVEKYKIIPLATTPKFLGIPSWVYFVAFIAFWPLLACGWLVYGQWSYNQMVASPVSANNGTVEVWTNKKCYNIGDRMSFRATVTNTTQYDYVAHLENEPVLDLIVRFDAAHIYKWSDGKAMTPDLTQLRIPPHNSKTIEMELIAPKIYSYGSVYAPFKLHPNDSPGGHPNVSVQVGQCLPGFIGY